MKISIRVILLVFSIILNALGNALTIKVALGSAPWTAASLNVSKGLGISVGSATIIIGSIILILDDVLRRKFNRIKDLYNFLYLMSFGYIIDLWLLSMRNVEFHHFSFRLFLCIAGILMIGAAVSIYLRVDLVFHPCDDLLNILRRKYLNGNVIYAEIISLGLPLCISGIFGVVQNKIYGINIGTLISFMFLGFFIHFFDRTIQLNNRPIVQLQPYWERKKRNE
ncbi:YczE/YyaS/YitT family protein [Niallia sp. 03133]|uniref:YczE/YyaS/YitT family protein n=1 Tax=Niallia sp. 03133 TaxID=3458060 RepID=UPI0040447F4D